MTRDELVESGAEAYLVRLTGNDRNLNERIDKWDRGVAAAVIDAILPLVAEAIAEAIEADHERAGDECYQPGMGALLWPACSHFEDARIAREWAPA